MTQAAAQALLSRLTTILEVSNHIRGKRNLHQEGCRFPSQSDDNTEHVHLVYIQWSSTDSRRA